MRVLRYLAYECAAVGLRHPVFRLDFFLGVDTRLESRQLFGGFRAVVHSWLAVFLIKALCVHEFSLRTCGGGPGPANGSAIGFRIAPLICHGFRQLSTQFVSVPSKGVPR